MEEVATAYFSSINPLARKVWEDTRKVEAQYESEWSDWEWQHREHVLDDFLIHSVVKNRYSTHECAKDKVYPDSFPKPTQSCGEKIVVDFDNDCWTWQDEHSGPFSWKTKSQQDLSLADLEPSLLTKPASKPHGSSPGVTRKTNSKLRDENGKGGVSRRIWDSPFHVVERKGDSGYPSSQDSIQSSFDDVRTRAELEQLDEGHREKSASNIISSHGNTKPAILNISPNEKPSDKAAPKKSPKSPKKSPLKSPISSRLPLSPSFNKRVRSGFDDTGVTLLVNNKRDSMGQDNAAFMNLTDGEGAEGGVSEPLSLSVDSSVNRIQLEGGEWAKFVGEGGSDTLSDGVASPCRRPLIGTGTDSRTEEGGTMNHAADIPSEGHLLSSETFEEKKEEPLLMKSGFDFLDNW